MQATFIRNALKNGVIATMPLLDEEAAFPSNLIFENPTITLLSRWLENALLSKEKKTDSGDIKQNSRTQKMEDMVSKYATDLPIREESKGQQDLSSVCVLLTGSTGNLGSYLLEFLIENPQVESVWALNHHKPKSGVLERQQQACRDRGISESILHSSKLNLLEGDVSKVQFGLSDEHWQEVRSLKGT